MKAKMIHANEERTSRALWQSHFIYVKMSTAH